MASAVVDKNGVEAVIYGEARVPLPRVAIRFCVQCKWNLRAAYYAQELLQTFSTSLGEVSLIPATDGIFTITIRQSDDKGEVLLWDRKSDSGFPEIKELKRRVRDLIDPGRGLGHVDRHAKKSPPEESGTANATNESAGAGTAAEAATNTTLEGHTIKIAGMEVSHAKAIVEHESGHDHTHGNSMKCEDCA